MQSSRDTTSVIGAPNGLNSREIARLAGVSQSTVSRVLSGHPHVADRTRQRVLEVIEQNRYVPNALARNLVTKRSSTIGLLVSNITNHFYPELIEAVCAIAADSGLSVVLANTQQDPERQRDYLRLLVEQRVAGILLTSVMTTAPYVLELLEERYPLVLVNRHLTDVVSDAVVIDNYGGAKEAVRHFVALGHRRIGFVRGVYGTTTNENRERGYRDGLREAELPLNPAYLLQGNFTWQGAYQAANMVANLESPPTAMLCADDETALGFIAGLANAGIQVPQDCAVIGFDDIRMASFGSVSLSTVRQPVTQMAELAMDLLIRRIEGDHSSPQVIVLPAELVIRGSSGEYRQEETALERRISESYSASAMQSAS